MQADGARQNIFISSAVQRVQGDGGGKTYIKLLARCVGSVCRLDIRLTLPCSLVAPCTACELHEALKVMAVQAGM